MSRFHSVMSVKTPIGLYSYKIHLVEKGNSKLSKSIHKNIEDFYDTGNINRYQLTKSYKMLTFPHCLLFLSYIKLWSMLSLIDIFVIQLLWHLFRILFFLYLKTLLLRTNLCASCYVTHHLSLNLFRLKDILLIMFYVNLSCHVIPFLLYHQLML